MKLTAEDLFGMGLVDKVIPEPAGGAHQEVRGAAASLKSALLAELESLDGLSEEELLEARYAKFRQAGEWTG